MQKVRRTVEHGCTHIRFRVLFTPYRVLFNFWSPYCALSVTILIKEKEFPPTNLHKTGQLTHVAVLSYETLTPKVYV